MQEKETQYDVGVIVGRFQVHELHEGHLDLIDYVCGRHNKVIVVLGLSPVTPSLSNPLDFEARKQMILESYPNVIVVYVMDQGDDATWSRKLENAIMPLIMGGQQSTVLYGGRDSFIEHYTGPMATAELTQSEFWSGTAVRKQIARSSVRNSPDFRAGVVWATSARFPTAYQTVDVAVLNEDGQKILLGRKPNEKQFRFIGGFSDPRSDSLETDARREVAEEAGVEVGDVTYLGSRVQDDWRYANEADCIKTALFKAKYVHGRPTPGDDIEEVRWFGLGSFSGSRSDTITETELKYTTIVESHRPLMAMLFDYLTKKNGER